LLAAGIKGPLNERQAESVQRIRSCATDELALLDDLLDASRAESGFLSITMRETNVPMVVLEVIEEHQAVATIEGHSLEAKVPPSVHAIVTDRNRLKQILSNLVSNAIKYSQPNGAITVSVKEETREGVDPAEGWTSIDVADSGPGIPADKHEQIFDEFVRLESGAHMPGSGLGLSVARRLARRLGGEIEVKNAGGAVFTVWLPHVSAGRG
jgi:signal transduction histidine kinase